MQQKAFSILKISDWILKLAYLNALFIAFSFLGCLIGGFFPATTAMLTVIRKWLMGDTEIPVFSTFWVSYKKDFLRSNLLGYILTFIGFTIFMYYLLLNQTVSEVAVWLRYPLVIITIIYIAFLLYVFPVFVHYEMKIPQILKTTFDYECFSTFNNYAHSSRDHPLLYNVKFPGTNPSFWRKLNRLYCHVVLLPCIFTVKTKRRKNRGTRLI
ncbi:YesL family protein [Ectobacillus funiculus]